MGWRIRKPINFRGGFRLNLSRHGLGFSWGFPMFRTGISADGRRYIWITIPRTGVSWIKYFGGKGQKRPAQTQVFPPATAKAPAQTPPPTSLPFHQNQVASS